MGRHTYPSQVVLYNRLLASAPLTHTLRHLHHEHLNWNHANSSTLHVRFTTTPYPSPSPIQVTYNIVQLVGVLSVSALDRLRNLDHSCVPVLLYYDPPYPCQRPTSAQIATVCQASIVSDNIDDRRVFLDRHRITHPAARHTHREDYILVPDDHSPNTTDPYDTTWIGVTLSDVPLGIYPTY